MHAQLQIALILSLIYLAEFISTRLSKIEKKSLYKYVNMGKSCLFVKNIKNILYYKILRAKLYVYVNWYW